MSLEHRQRVGLANPRVVRDLVVAHERRVADGHALDDVGHQQRRHEVAHHDRDRRADEGIEALALHVRGTAAALAGGRAALVRDVGERQHDRAHEPVRIGEVGEQVARLRSAAVADDAHRGRAARRVARRTCSRDSCPRRASRPWPVRSTTLDLGGVGGVVGDHRATRLLLIPAERGHVPVAAEQQPRLARAGLRGEVALPAQHPVAAICQPARDRRHVSIAHRFQQHSLPEPVDLEQDHARDVAVVLGDVRRARVAAPRAGATRPRRRRAGAPRASTRGPGRTRSSDRPRTRASVRRPSRRRARPSRR